MATNPPEGMPRVSPMLWYRDVASALDQLAKCFGFEQKMSMPGPDGSIMHAEMTVGESVLMLGPPDGSRGTASPSDLPGVNASLYVYVDDVDAHCARARAAGAEIVDDPETMFWGDRIYTARDGEGHRWTFSQKVRDVPPEEMKPPGA